MRIEKMFDLELEASGLSAVGVAGGVRGGAGYEEFACTTSDSLSENSLIEVLDVCDSLRVKLEFLREDALLVGFDDVLSEETLSAGSSPPPDRRR
jgi:hypothetical protein